MAARRSRNAVDRYIGDIRRDVLGDCVLHRAGIEAFGCDRRAHVQEAVVDGIFRDEG